MSFILVTGANGFVATHIIDQLLDAGHYVRGTVRSPRLESIRGAYASYGSHFEVVAVDDLSKSDLTEAFKDVRALIHVATPLPGTTSPEVTLKTAVEVTGSIITLFNPDDKWTDITVDETFYAVSKKLSEQAVWKFASEHPDIDVTTILPSWCFGPLSRHEPDPIDAITTRAYLNLTFYYMINGFEGRPFAEYAEALSHTYPAFVHISDIARAHILALDVPPSPKPKRITICGGYLVLSEAVRHIARVRPELKDRLPVLEDGFTDDRPYVKFDTSAMENVLRMTGLKTWQETIEDTIDAIVAIQKQAV
ncbi:hypothetical protein EWM64_g5383 [Hericium alpestre]|uniref:NAD-dependent epimerase/dehydratase domain-containing protein n=1 Tax=Hericium alpestre TaxID=135208 RepID=A0A4Y9ZX41_9AGAM|nr:hypothetical protein EWM64_g5383 [Hericium alpestre]